MMYTIYVREDGKADWSVMEAPKKTIIIGVTESYDEAIEIIKTINSLKKES